MAKPWGSDKNYDIGGESPTLQSVGVPFLEEKLAERGPFGTDSPLFVDFGCWSGRHLRLLHRLCADHTPPPHNPRVIGIDQPDAESRLEDARRTYPDFQILGTGLVKTGLSEWSVDAAICWRVLHNLTEEDELTNALAEIRRVLKERAPLVVAVRAAHEWMNDDAPIPIRHRVFSGGSEREDYYFSEIACRSTFAFFGFDVHSVHHFPETEVWGGEVIENAYWLVALTCDKSRKVGQLVANGKVYASPPAGSELAALLSPG